MKVDLKNVNIVESMGFDYWMWVVEDREDLDLVQVQSDVECMLILFIEVKVQDRKELFDRKNY